MSEQKVVKSKWLLDMVSDKPIEDGAVIFQDGKIKLSGHYEKIKGKIHPDAKVYDYKDKIIIPGMVDCHTHHNGFGFFPAFSSLLLLRVCTNSCFLRGSILDRNGTPLKMSVCANPFKNKHLHIPL